jgi:hypothetical protein
MAGRKRAQPPKPPGFAWAQPPALCSGDARPSRPLSMIPLAEPPEKRCRAIRFVFRRYLCCIAAHRPDVQRDDGGFIEFAAMLLA